MALSQKQIDNLISQGVSPEQMKKFAGVEVPKGGRITNTRFGERFRFSFGSTEAKEKQQNLEKQIGLKGKIDIGDIADVAGGVFPLLGAILGGIGASPTAFFSGPVGPSVGAGLGAAAGEATKQTVGQFLDVRKDASPIGEALRPVASGVLTAVGSKIIQKVSKPVGKFVGKILPRKLFNQVFRRAQEDVGFLLKTEAMADLKKTNPELFNKFVTDGIIKLSKGGAIEVNPTLAQEVLDRGLFGTSEGMAKYTVVKQLQMESAVRQLVKQSPKKVVLENKQAYIRLLTDLQKGYQKIGQGAFSQTLKEVDEVVKALGATKGNSVDANLALTLRRLLDGFRQTNTFRSDVNFLAPKQEAFKVSANQVRQALTKVPGIESTMNEYRIWIEAFEALVDDSVRRGNLKLLGLQDVIIGGGGLSSGAPGQGLGIAALVRALQQPFSVTGLGQALKTGTEAIQKTAPVSLPSAGFGVGRAIRKGIRGILGEN